MQLVDLQLTNFRAFEKRQLKFAPQMTLLVGENGSGKTTILEAIHLLSVTRSFRTTKYGELTRSGADHYQAKATVRHDGELITLETNGLPDGTRRFFLDGVQEKSFKEILGRMPVVTLVPEDIALIQGPDSDRRAFVDRILGTTDRTYLDSLVGYRHVLRQRNAALRIPGGRKENIEVWNVPLSDYAEIIWRQRESFLEKFGKLFSRFWDRYGLDFDAHMIYTAPTYIEAKNYVEHLATNLDRDLNSGRTSSGPHRDGMNIEIDGRVARSFGSMGEQKLLLATLKLSEARYVHETLDRAPILLLDDLFATLDQERAALLLGELTDEYQTVLTTTRLEGPLEETANLPGSEIVNCTRESLWLA